MKIQIENDNTEALTDPKAWASYNQPNGISMVLCCICRCLFKFPMKHVCKPIPPEWLQNAK